MIQQPDPVPPVGIEPSDRADADRADADRADADRADADRADAGLADAGLADAGLIDDDLANAERTEPSEAELYGMWPDPYCDPPDDVADWAAGLSAAELDEIFGVGQPCPGPEPADADQDGLLDVLAPGSCLAGLSQDAFESGLGRLSDDDLVGLLGAARRLSSWQAAIELHAVAELDARRCREADRPGSSRASEHVSSELAAALALTARSADALLGLSRGLARLPMVLTALLSGRIDRQRAEIFVAELSVLGDVAAAAVAAAFCDLAGSMTTGQLRHALRTMVLAIDPAAARQRAERGKADARVETWQEGSGNVALAGRELPAADAIAADHRIAAIARALKNAGAPGGMDQLRAAVFAALLTGRDPESLVPSPPASRTQAEDPAAGHPAPDPPAPAAPGEPAPAASATSGSLSGLTGSVNLTMPVSVWLGESDAPGEIAGLGPVDADTCRDLAARMTRPGTRWGVTLTDRGGRAVAHARVPPGAGPPGAGPPGAGPPGAGPPGDRAGWLAALKLDWLERGGCAHPRRADSYRPPARLRELVKVRQRTCAFPGCRRPAQACDDDHTIAFDRGGPTCECNLAALCRRHHRCKQAPGWRLDQPEPGVLVWTAPHGRRYTVGPGSYPV